MGMSVLYTLRIAVQSPDVSWNRKTNPEPWQHYSEKKYKVSHLLTFMSDFGWSSINFSLLQFMYPTAEFKPSQAPKYLE